MTEVAERAAYLREWNSLVDALEQALGVVCIGFDPGVLMRDRGRDGSTVDIPRWFAERIVSAIQKESKT